MTLVSNVICLNELFWFGCNFIQAKMFEQFNFLPIICYIMFFFLRKLFGFSCRSWLWIYFLFCLGCIFSRIHFLSTIGVSTL